jgi:hypothetical protein
MFMRVVLPEPDGPMMASHSPGETFKETFWRALTGPYILEISIISRILDDD